MILAITRILVLVLFCLANIASGQTQEDDDQDSVKILTFEEKMPIPPGGSYKDLHKIIEDSLKYPESAIKDRIGGKVVTQFLVDTNGNVRDITIIKGVRADIDNEAIRIIAMLNGWIPGTQNGKKVIVKMTLPLTFYPDNRWKRKYERRERRKLDLIPDPPR